MRPEGIKKEVYELYRDTTLSEKIPSKAKRRRLKQFVSHMAVDFYNLECTEEQIRAYASEYMLWDMNLSPEPMPDLTLAELNTLMLFQLEENGRNINEHEIFCSIVDRLLAGQKLTEEQFEHAKRRYHGKMWQAENQQTGTWRIHHEHYLWKFMNYPIYRVLYEWLIELSRGKVEVGRCAAEDCKNIFVPYKSGKGQRFCSGRCRSRMHKRKMAGLRATGSRKHTISEDAGGT